MTAGADGVAFQWEAAGGEAEGVKKLVDGDTETYYELKEVRGGGSLWVSV